MAIRNVLIVDDSKTELMFLSELLKKNGFSVTTAENAEDTYKRLAEAIPDLILMDVVMPGQNGFQLTRAITRDPKYANMPRDHVHEQEPGNGPGRGSDWDAICVLGNEVDPGNGLYKPGGKPGARSAAVDRKSVV